MIVLENIVKEYASADGSAPFRALDGVSLVVEDGEFVAVMGPSGSGKSTLMNLVGLLDRPTSGRYLLDTESVEHLTGDAQAKIRGERIGFVFQGYNLIPRMTALEQVMMPLAYRGTPLAQRKALAAAALARVGLSGRENSMPNQLSGGQQQRVAVARAIAGSPSVLLADEPTGALDTRTGAEVMELFSKLNAEGSTVVLITHAPEVAQKARRIVSIRDGKILSDVLNAAAR